MGILRTLAWCLVGIVCMTGATRHDKRASLQQVTNFGANTSGTKMFIYVPDKLAANPAIIVAMHYCTGTAQAYYSNTPYAQLSEQYGFIVIYPESPYNGGCWDVSSTASLTHNGGADSNSIANMVSYTLNRYNADSKRVFVTGTSSGAMMTVRHSVIHHVIMTIVVHHIE
jgi:acetylxylan esterase